MKRAIAGRPRSIARATAIAMLDRPTWKAVAGRLVFDPVGKSKRSRYDQSGDELLQRLRKGEFPTSDKAFSPSSVDNVRATTRQLPMKSPKQLREPICNLQQSVQKYVRVATASTHRLSKAFSSKNRRHGSGGIGAGGGGLVHIGSQLERQQRYASRPRKLE